MSVSKIVVLCIVLGVICVVKFVIDVLILSNLISIKNNTNFTANKLKQLCKLTSDNQIYVRGVYNAVSGDEETLFKIAQEIEQRKKRTRKAPPKT